MKESVTKFDFESAFKALDEIDIPVAEPGIRANRPALTEIFSRKTKFDSLFEEYYDINNSEELTDAQEAREAEVAKAKLARIEKIVDLDADSPEDLLTSYVGKYIMQCPQCMKLLYKDKEDVVESEEDPLTVNVNEVCQHCGNESGYTLVGKVGEAEADEEPAEEMPLDDLGDDEGLEAEENTEEAEAEATEEEDLEELNLDELDLNLDEEEVEVEESFTEHDGETLVEELADEKELDDKLEAHSEYIEYLRDAIAQEEQKLEKANNEQVKTAIQRNIDAFKADLEAALPDAVKNDTVEESEETAEEADDTDALVDELVSEEDELDEAVESLTEALREETDLAVSADEFEKLINSPEFKKPISDSAVRAMLNDEKEEEDEVEESLEEALLIEGNLVDFGKALLKKVTQVSGNFKKKASAAIDALTKNTTTREEKADWVLANTLKDYTKAKVNKTDFVPDEENRKFKTFLVISFSDKDAKGKEFTAPPAFNQKGLVLKEVQEKKTYKEAEAAAKGWSMLPENGPVFIYLAESKEDSKAAFLCEFFDGKLEFDQLDKYFDTVKKHLEGVILLAQSNPSSSTEETTSETEEMPATESLEVNNELSAVVEGMEELHEASLESQIAKSLAETCGNVDSFAITDCSYLNEKLSVEGTITFKSGNTENTAFVFTEARINDKLVSLVGCNEALGTKNTIAGRVVDKVFITESFN